MRNKKDNKYWISYYDTVGYLHYELVISSKNKILAKREWKKIHPKCIKKVKIKNE